MSGKTLTRKEAAKFLGCGEFHLGNLLRDNKIEGAYKDKHPTRDMEVWFIPMAGLEKYKANVKSGVGKRADGRNKYTLYASAAELAKLQALIKEAKLQIPPITRANPTKGNK